MYSCLPDYANADAMRRQQTQQQPRPQQLHRQPMTTKRRRSPQPPASLVSSSSGGGCGGGGELDERAGRFASALLLLAALVLAVDASRLALYSWYSEGSYLGYAYGDRPAIDWPRCEAPAAVPAPPPLLPLAPPPEAAAASYGGRFQREVRGAGDDAVGDDWLAEARKSAATGVLLAGEALSAGLLRQRPRRPPKPLSLALCHVSSAACVCLLLTALVPACLRSERPARCALAAAAGLAAASVSLAGLSVSACIVKIYLFTLCEVSPPPPTQQAAVGEPRYDLVPPCPLLRKAYFCAECFSLLVLIAAACMALCLLAFFSRALSCCCCCCRSRTRSSSSRCSGVEEQQQCRRQQHRCYGNGRHCQAEEEEEGDDFPV